MSDDPSMHDGVDQSRYYPGDTPVSKILDDDDKYRESLGMSGFCENCGLKPQFCTCAPDAPDCYCMSRTEALEQAVEFSAREFGRLRRQNTQLQMTEALDWRKNG